MRRSERTILNGMKRAEKSKGVRFMNNINEILNNDCSSLDHYYNTKNYYSLDAIAKECSLLIQGLNFYNWEYDHVIVEDLSGCKVERDINIHSLLKPFILPRSVRLEPSNLDSKDLINREGYKSDIKELTLDGTTRKVMDKKEHEVLFTNRVVYFDSELQVPVINEKALITLNTILNKVFLDDSSNVSNLVSWNSLRLNVSLSSVIDTISIGDKCKYSDYGFIDIALVDSVSCLFNDSWFNSSVEENVVKLEYYYKFK